MYDESSEEPIYRMLNNKFVNAYYGIDEDFDSGVPDMQNGAREQEAAPLGSVPMKGARGRGLQGIPVLGSMQNEEEVSVSVAPKAQHEERLVGVGGEHHWLLEITDTGSNTLRFSYRRAWETDTQEGTRLLLTSLF